MKCKQSQDFHKFIIQEVPSNNVVIYLEPPLLNQAKGLTYYFVYLNYAH